MLQALLKRRIILVIVDIFSIAIAGYLAVLVRFGFRYANIPDYYLIPINRFIAINIVLTMVLLFLFRMYQKNWDNLGWFGLVRFVAPCFLSTASCMIGLYFFRIGGQAVPRSYYIIYFFMLLTLIILSRLPQLHCALSGINDIPSFKSLSESLSYQNISARVRASITKTDKQAFFSSLVCCFFGYAYFGFHMIPNHDGIVNLNWNIDETYIFGRWSRTALSSISDFYTPWLLVITAFLAMSVSAVMVVRLLNIKRLLAVAATAVCLTLSPPVVSAIIFTYMVDGFFIGLSLSIAAAYVIERCKTWWAGLSIGAVLIAVSMGEYQMFVCVVIALFSVRLLQILIKNESSNREIIFFSIKYISLVVSAVGLYYVLNRIILSALDLAMGDYVDLDKAIQLDFRSRLDGVIFAYQSVGEHLAFSLKFGGSFTFYMTALLFAMIPILGFILLFSIKKRPVFQVALIIFMIVALPLLINSVFLMRPEYVSRIMKYPACFIFICGIVLTEELSRRKINDILKNVKLFAVSLLTWVMLAGTILIGFRWGVIANEAGTILELQNRNFTALCIRIVDRIEQYPEFDVHRTPVYIGFEAMFPHNSNYPETKPFFRKFNDGFYGLYGFDYTMFTNTWDRLDTLQVHQYINDYIGFRYINSGYSVKAIKESDAYKNMPCFPDSESLAMIDGVLVVKLTDD